MPPWLPSLATRGTIAEAIHRFVAPPVDVCSSALVLDHNVEDNDVDSDVGAAADANADDDLEFQDDIIKGLKPPLMSSPPPSLLQDSRL